MYGNDRKGKNEVDPIWSGCGGFAALNGTEIASCTGASLSSDLKPSTAILIINLFFNILREYLFNQIPTLLHRKTMEEPLNPRF